MSEPRPATPRQEGVPERSPEMMQVEAARLLANEARPRLHERGFEDEQIRRWAETYVAEEGSGDVDAFIDWIRTSQGPDEQRGGK